MLYRNGVVVTMDDARPRAEAVLVRGDRLAAVGSNQEVAGRAGPGATVIDLGGRTIVPGFTAGNLGTIDMASIEIWLADPRQMIYGTRPSP